VAWNGQGPEILLLHVMLEVADALCAPDIPSMLDRVEWGILQQEEVAALVDWCLQMPQEWPLTPLLKDRALRAVSAQISGHHQRCARVPYGCGVCGFVGWCGGGGGWSSVS